jgi:hypothetical protein
VEEKARKRLGIEVRALRRHALSAPSGCEHVADTRIAEDEGDVGISAVDGTDSFVLQKGHISADEPTLARVHTISILDDMLGQPGPRKRTLQRAMGEIGRHGSGVIVLLISPREGTSSEGGGTAPDMDLRSYGIGAQILADLGGTDVKGCRELNIPNVISAQFDVHQPRNRLILRRVLVERDPLHQG